MATRAVARVRAGISPDPLDIPDLVSELGGPGDGGVALFVGRVRDRNEGRVVRSLEYEAYREMAEKELARICEDVAGRFAIGELRARHRTGTLRPGEASVAVAAAAPHRAEAFGACRAAMEEIKHRLPVWKRETYEDGSRRWLDGARPSSSGGGP